MSISYKNAAVAVAVAMCTLFASVAYAANTATFSITIGAGTLSVDIVDASGTSVASPTVSFSGGSVSTGTCTRAGSSVTGMLGVSTAKIRVSNPDAADNGWNLTMAPSARTSTWSNSGATQTFDFNDPGNTGSEGCSDKTSSGDHRYRCRTVDRERTYNQ